MGGEANGSARSRSGRRGGSGQLLTSQAWGRPRAPRSARSSSPRGPPSETDTQGSSGRTALSTIKSIALWLEPHRCHQGCQYRWTPRRLFPWVCVLGQANPPLQSCFLLCSMGITAQWLWVLRAVTHSQGTVRSRDKCKPLLGLCPETPALQCTPQTM